MPLKNKIWINPNSIQTRLEVTNKEYIKASQLARDDLLKNKKPVPKGKTPKLIFTRGAPGSGKSTVADLITADERDKYVYIDYDVALKYHPRYKGIWNVKDVTGNKSTNIGYINNYMTANKELIDILSRIYYDIISGKGPKYNIVLQSHIPIEIIPAKIEGYHVTYIFVGTPLHIAQERGRKRAIETGKFLAANLKVQDKLIEGIWREYKITAVWHGMWADKFMVIDNRGTLDDIKITKIELHCQKWERCLDKAQKAVDASLADKK